jgi:hypothetical protein
MSAWKYVGRAPNSDASLVTKGHTDGRHAALAVTEEYINGAVAAHAVGVNLVDQAYVDARDATRAKKTAVEAADALYLPTTARGATNGVAPLDASGNVLSEHLPSGLPTSLPVTMIEAQTVNLTSAQVLTSTVTKTYLAAVLDIADPGYAYTPLVLGYVRGRCPGVYDHSRRVGGSHRGKMTILTNTDQLIGGVAGNSKGSTLYPVIPTAAIGASPFALTGGTTMHLWLALMSGTSYIFEPDGLRFFAIIQPAG